MINPTNPLIVQSDRTLLLDVHAPRAQECRNALIPFAELERSPEHLHTYRLTPLSLWNAASSGFTWEQAVAVLHEFARYDVPEAVDVWIKETAGRFGKLRLVPGPVVQVCASPSKLFRDEAADGGQNGCNENDSVLDSNLDSENKSEDKSENKENKSEKKTEQIKTVDQEYLYLVCTDPYVYKEIDSNPFARKLLLECTYEKPAGDSTVLSENEKKFCFMLNLTDRGTVKQNLLQLGWPVKDDVPLVDGEPCEISLRETTAGGKPFAVRGYQKEAAETLVGDKGPGTGFGTIVLPCGSGKTIVGMTVMSLLKTNTLIITTNISAVHQWIDELVDKTNLTRDDISEYTGEEKTIKPVTVATYQILTWRPDKAAPYPHFALFRKRNWGLIIYDEVHMLPAPVFRVAAELQAVRRVGLTATLVREDGCEGHVFSLVGPKRYDVPWKELEHSGYIAKAECVEVRVDFDEEQQLKYAVAGAREKYRIASENPVKFQVVQELVQKYADEKILVIGQYLKQLDELARLLKAPILTGKTPNSERDVIYSDFRNGNISVLVVSKVANFAIDLPDASMAIQVSGTFGSRQEEAQRLGRILRPKEKTSRFITLITRNSSEEDFGSNRQKFLAEQGYSYRIIRYTDSTSFDQLDSTCAIEM